MNEEKSNRSHLLGFEKTTLNYFLLGICIFPIFLFIWDAFIIVKHPFIFTLLNSTGVFCGAVGILLYVNGRLISGIIGIIGQLALYVFIRLFYRMNLLKIYTFGYLLLC